ncbi:MAG: response regulator [Firmicutes bacterium]|nr:response regulator [Bacillota bacterium]
MIVADVVNIIPLVVIIFTIIAAIYFLWGQPLTPSFKVVVFLLLFTAGWAFSYLFELVSEAKLRIVFWNKVGFVMITAINILMLLLGLQYSRKYEKRSRLQLILIIIPPVLTLSLFWAGIVKDSVWNQTTLIHLGAWVPLVRRSVNFPFLIHIGLTYLYLFAGAYLTAKTYLKTVNLFRRQAVLVSVAFILLFAGDIFSNFNLFPFSGIDPMIHIVTLAVLLGVTGLFGHYLPVVPIARTTVVNSMNDAVFVLDDHYRVVDLNLAGEKLLGLTIQEVAGKFVKNYLPLELDTDTKEPKPGQTELMIEKGGQGYYFHVQITPLFKKRPHPFGHLVVIRDLTEKKRIELLQRKIEDEILKNQKLESLGLLAGGIAHDFNNALAVILSNVQVIKLSLTKGKDVTKYLDATEATILKAAALTKQLMAFTKGGMPVRKITALPKLIQDTVDFALLGSNVKAEYFFGEGIWPGNIDEAQFSQVINNLTLNAIQAMPGGGTIKIYLENLVLTKPTYLPVPEGKYLKITIEDQGVGIPPENLSRIFDPYFTTKATGSGLGLTTSFTIIKRHDGYLTVDSTPGVGTAFKIYLPAFAEAAVAAEPELSKPVPGPGSAKILLMDNEEEVRKVTAEILAHLGYTVKLAADGSEAIAMYEEAKRKKEPFQAVILDLTIPGGVGAKEILVELAKIDPKVKAIVSSGYTNSAVMAEYTKYGFRGMLTKPYKIEDLSAVLRNVLQNGRNG